MAKEVIVRIGKEKYKTEIQIDNHKIVADEPKDVGGGDLGPAPTEFLLSSLGTCKAMTVRMYADRKAWGLDKVDIKLSISFQKSEQQKTAFIKCHINLEGDLDNEQRQRLLYIADKCPVHGILSNPIVIESNLV